MPTSLELDSAVLKSICIRKAAAQKRAAVSLWDPKRQGKGAPLDDLGKGAIKFIRSQPNFNGKVGVFGTCSGGRHGFLAACRLKGIDALVECWGGRVVASKEELTPKQPVAPVDYTKDLSCPMLGLFGNDDKAPSPEQVNKHEEELKKHGKKDLQRAKERLLELKLRNVVFRWGDGWEGWPALASYHGIMVTAAAPDVPPALLEQLAPGGRLVIPVGTGDEQQLLLIVRETDGFRRQVLETVRFVPLLQGSLF